MGCSYKQMVQCNVLVIQGTRESKAGDGVDTLGERFRYSESDGDLTILNVHVDDEQWYWCEASNRAGKVSAKSYFEVQGKVM